jgi:hypothetical protein
MSDNDWGFAPPPFDAQQALLQLQRAMRDNKLAGRGTAFELRGKAVVDLQCKDDTVAVRLARRLALTPEWDTFTVKNAADQRKLIDEVKRRLARWLDEE